VFPVKRFNREDVETAICFKELSNDLLMLLPTGLVHFKAKVPLYNHGGKGITGIP